MKLSLTNRKALKTQQEKIEAEVKNASAAWGSPLTWIDNSEAHCAAIMGSQGEEQISSLLESQMLPHVKRFAALFTEMKKEPDTVASFTPLFNGKIGVKIIDRGTLNDKYWVIEDGALFARTEYCYIGNYIDYFTLESLKQSLTSTERPFKLSVVKNLNTALPVIAGHMEAISKAVGRTITLTDNYNELINALSEDKRNTFGDVIRLYPQTLAEELAKFCADKDNLEALQESWTSNTVTIRFVGADTYYAIADGNFFIEVNPAYWGSYLSYFNAAIIEKLL